MTGSTGPVGLLDAIVRDALDPSYAEAAARHQAERAISSGPGAGEGGASRWRAASRTNIVGAALLLGAGALAGIAISSEQRVIPQVSAARSALAGSADAQTKQVRALEQALAGDQREVAALQQQRLQATSTGRLLQKLDSNLSAAAAEAGASGPGITVSVADSGPAGSSAGQVTDRDLQDIVNALWASGAQAISVGGVRLGPQTAIRTAGQTILVGFQPLRSPYLIRAIGGARLQRAGQSTSLLAGAGDPSAASLDVKVEIESALTLPAAAPGHVAVGHALAPGGHS